MRVDCRIGQPRRHAPDDVADRDAGGAPRLRFPQRRQRVRGLARLGDHHGQRAVAGQRIAIAILGSVVDVDAHPRELLDEELPHQRGMPGRPAGQEGDLLDGPQPFGGDVELAQQHGSAVFGQAPGHRLADGPRLLEDLLEHEVLVARLLRRDRIPLDPFRGLRDRPPRKVGERHPRPRDDRHLAVAEEDDVRRVAAHRRDVRGEEELAATHADDDRRAVAHRDDLVRIAGRRQDQHEQAAELLQRAPDGVLEAVVALLLLDEMRDDLGVGLRLEAVAGRQQPALQVEVVLDDAVVHDDEAARAVAVRVRVLFRRTAVGCPAGVPDAVVAADRRRPQGLRQPRHLAGAAADRDLPVAHQRDAGRVVTPVLELAEALEQDGDHLTVADVADDAAHARPPTSIPPGPARSPPSCDPSSPSCSPGGRARWPARPGAHPR